MDMGDPSDLNFDPLEPTMSPHPQQQQQQQQGGPPVTAWYDTDL